MFQYYNRRRNDEFGLIAPETVDTPPIAIVPSEKPIVSEVKEPIKPVETPPIAIVAPVTPPKSLQPPLKFAQRKLWRKRLPFVETRRQVEPLMEESPGEISFTDSFVEWVRENWVLTAGIAGGVVVVIYLLSKNK
jgi:hypothetical protein